MTDSVDYYIKEMTMEIYSWYDSANGDFQEDIDNIIHDKFNMGDDNWNDYGKPSLDEFIIIQHACCDYLDGNGCLELITDKKRDWKWWYNIYAISMEWMGGSFCGFKDECFKYEWEDAIIMVQSHIRRRQATKKIILTLLNKKSVNNTNLIVGNLVKDYLYKQ